MQGTKEDDRAVEWTPEGRALELPWLFYSSQVELFRDGCRRGTF